MRMEKLLRSRKKASLGVTGAQSFLPAATPAPTDIEMESSQLPARVVLRTTTLSQTRTDSHARLASTWTSFAAFAPLSKTAATRAWMDIGNF